MALLLASATVMAGAVRDLVQRIGGPRAKESEGDAQRRRMDTENRMSPPDPPPCPPGWEPGPPAFIGIGETKAGTSWWSHQLFIHPHGAKPVLKELHYFQHWWNSDFDDDAVNRYHQYFPRRSGIVTGEWTPRYMMDPWTPVQLQKAAPEARLLVLLRDPMPRLRSHLRQRTRRYGHGIHPRFVIDAIEAGRYATHLRHILRHFPRQQILVLQLESCIREPERELARTYEFVGLDSEFVPDDLRQPRGAGKGEPLVLNGVLYDGALEIYREEMKLLAQDWPELDLSLWPSI